MQESTQIFMNESNKSFYPSDMFEFIHHPEYGCRDLKGLRLVLQGFVATIYISCADLRMHQA
jgi:hypothetical protein